MIGLIKKVPSITRKEIAQRLNISEPTVARDLKLLQEIGSGFNRPAIFRMIKCYEEFPDVEIVATLSQQLSRSHFLELLPIKIRRKESFALLCVFMSSGM